MKVKQSSILNITDCWQMILWYLYDVLIGQLFFFHPFDHHQRQPTSEYSC